MTITEIKDRVLRTADIVEVIGEYVKLKRQAAEYVGLCPFHAERSPSFSVNQKKGIYKCFGCGASGDVIEFIKKQERLSFVDALKFIAASRHINVNFEHDEKRGKGKDFARIPEKQIKAVNSADMVRSMQMYQHNALARFLATRSTETNVLESFFKYNVGTAKDGGAIFWQIDQFMRIRTAQKIQYGLDGHRVKWRVDDNGFKQKVFPIRLFKQSDDYVPCLFGEHLLFDAKKDSLVCVVESEKTAVICDMYLPTINGRDAIWIASCGSNGLTEEKIWVLRGLNVCLCPDFSYSSRAIWGLTEMRKKEIDGRLQMSEDGDVDLEFVSAAIRLQKLGCNVSFFDPFPDKKDGSDIADELLRNRVPKIVAQNEPIEQIFLREGFF